MNIEALERALLDRTPEEPGAAARWREAVRRVIEAARVPQTFDEIADALPPKPRYIGPGPWLEAVKDSWRP